MPRAAPPSRADYAAFRVLPTRWMDNDEYGHMNNATYFSLFDTSVSLWQMDQGIDIRGPKATRFLVVESGCTYFAEAGFPDLIHAGLRLGHLGKSSFRYEIGLFRNEDDIACATGFFAQVHVDDTGRPAALTEKLRGIFATLLI